MVFARRKWRFRVECEPVSAPAKNYSISNDLFKSTPNVNSEHVDPTMPQFTADLASGLKIKVPIYPVTLAAFDGRTVLDDLLIALTCVCSS